MPARAITEGLFELHNDGSIELVGGYSPTSGRHHFPRLDSCPYSGATDVETVELSSEARLWAWTAVTAAPPGYAGEVPFGFGVVELVREQLRVITRLTEADPVASAIEVGQPFMDNAPLSIAGAKRQLNALADGTFDRELDAFAQDYRECEQSADHAEAEHAFAAKRPPRFTGR